jgi:signal transduction histidine kinase
MTPRRPVWERKLPLLFDLAATGIALLACVVSTGVPNSGLEVAMVGVPMALATLFRRRWPLSVLAIIAGLALLQVIGDGQLPAAYDVSVLIAMYTVVRHGKRTWHGYLAGVVTALGLLVLAAARGVGGSSGLTVLVMFAAICTATWLTAYVLRTRHLYVQSLEERAATAERERDHLTQLAAADERAAIARELHDVVAHSLAVMIVQADGATYAIDNAPDQARGAMGTIAATGRDALEDMRRIVGVLRGTTSTADETGERRRISVDQIGSLVDRAKSAGLAVELHTDGEPAGLSAAEELTVFRLVQEALTNALRHAGQGAQVAVSLTFRAGAVTLEIVDDGAGQLVTVGGDGFADTPSLLPPSGGHGVIGMRERVAVHGGEFSAGPRLGGGWRVWAVVPVKGVA